MYTESDGIKRNIVLIISLVNFFLETSIIYLELSLEMIAYCGQKLYKLNWSSFVLVNTVLPLNPVEECTKLVKLTDNNMLGNKLPLC